MMQPAFSLSVPPWLTEFMAAQMDALPKIEDRMGLAIQLSELNVSHQSGGPFGAVIFNTQTWLPMAAGVNLVETAACSLLHAEIVAIAVAQQRVNHFDLGAEGMASCELVSSTEPCAMCIGAICWSGVKSLVYGGSDEGARNIGFDEGPKQNDWQKYLIRRGIKVTGGLFQRQACRVLQTYVEKGGLIYNARSG